MALISLDHVSKVYPRGTRPALDDVTLHVERGDFVFLVGASGSGKTLLADAVLGLFEPNATVTGRIWFDGERMDAAGLRALRGHGLSLVPQSVSHLDPMMGVGKQVEGFANDLSKAERKARRAQLFERYGLGPEVARLYPHELSGGMARRVALARAIALDPALIMYDEPFAGLDPISLGVTANLIRKLNDALHSTSVIVTHDVVETFEIADYVYMINAGRVAAEGSPEELCRSEEPFVKQFINALPDGPVRFHYPANSIEACFGGEER